MDEFLKTYDFTKEEWNACLKVLATLKDSPFDNPENERFGALISKIHKSARKSNRKAGFKQKKSNDREVLNNSFVASQAINNSTTYAAKKEGEVMFTNLEVPKNCYCCNQSFSLLHSFYNRLCPECAATNYANRFKETDLTGRNVILTGGRVKIGYATALKFLRSNANLVVTTRFPALALDQFQQETDYETWKDNLIVYGLDLRKLKAVQEFITYYKTNHSQLDILVNNAAQTIKYTAEYYQPLIEKEQVLLSSFSVNDKLMPNGVDVSEQVNSLTVTTNNEDYALNRFGQPVDDREKNSWNSTLEEVSTVELLEVNLINQLSPYLMIKELTPLLKSSPFDKRYIVNVTSSEGQFSYSNKSIFHPHTNMTKASLNMLTRTSAKEYGKYGIYMNAVDVGWVSTGAKESLRKRQFEKGYIPPLDPVDGASRIMVPIIEGIEDLSNPIGKLLKNYRITDW